MTTRAQRMTEQLVRTFRPSVLHVQDDSAKHAGHAGTAVGGQTHYSLLIVAEAFGGQSRVARSRAVHAAIDAEFASGLHAVALTLRTPEEHAGAAS